MSINGQWMLFNCSENTDLSPITHLTLSVRSSVDKYTELEVEILKLLWERGQYLRPMLFNFFKLIFKIKHGSGIPMLHYVHILNNLLRNMEIFVLT